MRRSLILLTAVLALSPAVAQAAPHTLVTFTRSGGVAGLNDHLVVRSDGLATVTERDAAKARRHRVTAATLKRLRSAIAAAHVERPVPPGNRGCADCFSYAIGASGHRVRFSELDTPKRYRRLLDLLGRIVGGAR